jgi:hypothetical protein
MRRSGLVNKFTLLLTHVRIFFFKIIQQKYNHQQQAREPGKGKGPIIIFRIRNEENWEGKGLKPSLFGGRRGGV